MMPVTPSSAMERGAGKSKTKLASSKDCRHEAVKERDGAIKAFKDGRKTSSGPQRRLDARAFPAAVSRVATGIFWLRRYYGQRKII
jgi:hypothetical protein